MPSQSDKARIDVSTVTFKRSDLVAKANKIVADYYGEALADGRRSPA
jgi:hypothetical protein